MRCYAGPIHKFYQPGQVQPGTELVLSHKHPEDLTEVEGLLAQSAAPFNSSRHRIVTTAGEVRNVVVVGDTRASVTSPFFPLTTAPTVSRAFSDLGGIQAASQ
jgi:hypothetical protein